MTLPRWQRAYVIAMCAVIGAALAYAASNWAHWPTLTYLPVQGEWTMHRPPGAIAMNYLGVVAWGVGGAATGTLVGAAVCAVAKKPLSERIVMLLGAWAITAIVLAGAYFTWSVWPW